MFHPNSFMTFSKEVINQLNRVFGDFALYLNPQKGIWHWISEDSVRFGIVSDTPIVVCNYTDPLVLTVGGGVVHGLPFFTIISSVFLPRHAFFSSEKRLIIGRVQVISVVSKSCTLVVN
jgi:hypothetical protein